MQKVKKAVIPIGGIGSRFLPATKGVAKEMFPLVDKPILQEILQECVDSGIEEVFIVISPNKKNIINFIKRDFELEQRLEKDGKLSYLTSYFGVVNKLKIKFGLQKKALGNGDALFPAEKWTNGEPFAVLFGDDINYTPKGMRPAIGQCIDAYEKTGKLVVGCKPVPMNEIVKYGSCIVGDQISENEYEMAGIIEKPALEIAPSNLACAARYVVTPNIFDVLRNTPIDKRGELTLADAMDTIARTEGATICNFQSIRYDTGDLFGYLVAQIEYGLRGPVSEKLKEYLGALDFNKVHDLSKASDVIINNKSNEKCLR